jgi:hypothetical protein
MPYFGPFAANWVGIWVGKSADETIRLWPDSPARRPSGHSNVQALDVIGVSQE